MKVEFKKNTYEKEVINPNMIYNRCDLWSDNSYLIKVSDADNVHYLMAAIEGKQCYIGIWLMKIPQKVLQEVEKIIFKKYPIITTIKYEYALVRTGYALSKNHFKIDLPDNEEQLRSRLSKKGRYNIKREKDILIKTFGSFLVQEYTAGDCPKEIINCYFKFKKATHNINYHMSSSEYINKYHVSHIYVLYIDGIIGAILLSCEQCPIVYIENLTYDLKYSKFSCGQILYDIYLTKLIQKGFRELYLAGGNLAYKKRYGSTEEVIYNGIVFRTIFAQGVYIVRDFFHRNVKPLIKKII